MGEPDDPSLLRSVKSTAKALGLRRDRDPQTVLPTHHLSTLDGTSPTRGTEHASNSNSNNFSEKSAHDHVAHQRDGRANHNNVADDTSPSTPPPAPPPVNTAAAGEGAAAVEPKPPMSTRMKKGTIRFAKHAKDALTYSWVNVLLIFVPIGIATKPAHLAPEIVFSMNAIAIIPLAGLLAHATEAVAVRLGDTLGALLNVSFGNAVELILFIILLAGNQIRVVQAALLGSILANLLLILGMAFVVGGMRYQEQIYNSTVTQMSACMLSLAVMSLLLPTAFHAAFSSYTKADQQTLYVSRGTSVVLLIIYVLYLVFQLKSHAYMYASTPQHIIDEESHPGVLAGVLDSSSSSDSSSDSSSTDSDSTAGSTTTAKRIKRAFRHRKRRKSSASSKDTPSAPSVMSSPSVENHKNYFDSQRNGSALDDENAIHSNPLSRRGSVLNAILSGDEADTDDPYVPVVRDFEAPSSNSPPNGKREKKKKHKKKDRRNRNHEMEKEAVAPRQVFREQDQTPKVAFADEVQQGEAAPAARRPFVLRPALPSLLSNNVFSNPQNLPPQGGVSSNIRMAGPRTLRRTTSLPDRINRVSSQASSRYNNRPDLARKDFSAPTTATQASTQEEEAPVMSRTVAVVMLLISTGLVAICADFMSDAIEPMVENTGISQAFIGLIILPIVGNAAEHVTAVTVAAKNKMDLAIGVAVGSSIQIAIFITPFIVILGWIMGKEMSLYFNIFETVALFVTAFVVNFLVLDGRSNYLEGSLLIAAYVIIALASFFYPDGCDASQIGGQEGNC
ncbi:Sodium/calcium exchanger protein-domain-containing protein [Lophiotrema nucula]|uniref:Sodium/calcium exchanger protein-domain-containing protein n=1 Tax=Lophiotrema nucula TaxID=690887 RepID=A0A6A5ZFR1_9PLEO|nr:Sodium/calcium exchanger protein-domain-containing protein [Lophiotrema nucula]